MVAIPFEPPVLTGTNHLVAFAPGADVTLTRSEIAITDTQGRAADSEITITVTTPTLHGTLTRSGIAATVFTQQDINDGLIVYHHGGGLAFDFLDYFAAVTRLPRVAVPYTPQMLDAPTSGASDDGVIYIGMMLDGAGYYPPRVTNQSDAGDMPNFGGDLTHSAPVVAGSPNSVILVVSATLNRVEVVGGSPPASVVSSLTCPGLTFTRLQGASITISHPDVPGPPTHFPGHTECATVEVWWAPCLSAFAGTMTVTWSTAGWSQSLWYAALTGLANPSAPFDPNPSNFPVLTGTSATMPMVMTAMTPTAPDHSVATLYATSVRHKLTNPIGPESPHGFWDIAAGSGGFLCKRGPTSWRGAFSPEDEEPPVETLKLAMDNVLVVTEDDLSQNLVSLAASDDRGHSYGSPVSQSIGEIGEYRTSLSWRRLGMARDRVWELSWSVPMPTALMGCWLEVTPAES